MPIQTYECKECEHRFDDLVGTFQNYPEPTECPQCQGIIERVVSVPLKAIIMFGDDTEESHMNNRAWLESEPEIASGARKMHIPKNMPDRFQPRFS